MPRIMLAIVDLPEPDSPTIARHSPSATSKETSSTARIWCAPWVKILVTECSERSGVMAPARLLRGTGDAEIPSPLWEWEGDFGERHASCRPLLAAAFVHDQRREIVGRCILDLGDAAAGDVRDGLEQRACVGMARVFEEAGRRGLLDDAA